MDDVIDAEGRPRRFHLLLEQGPCLVVAKPGGLLTQSPPGIDSLEDRIKQFIKVRDEKPGKVYLGVPHRLDRPASGVMVFARHVRAARRLAEQFEGRLVGKRYWALVENAPTEDEGRWEDFVRKVPNEARAEVVDQGAEGAKHAVLRYRVRARLEDAAWLEIELETGRTHQIRLQASQRGFPLWGDSLYGATRPFGPETDDPRERWIALHARSLDFEHPMTREPLRVEAPLPSYWSDSPAARHLADELNS